MKSIHVEYINQKDEVEVKDLTGTTLGYEMSGSLMKFYKDDKTWILPADRLIIFEINTK